MTMEHDELIELIASKIDNYRLSDNMGDVGTDWERCFCDTDGGCRHEGYATAASIVRSMKWVN